MKRIYNYVIMDSPEDFADGEEAFRSGQREAIEIQLETNGPWGIFYRNGNTSYPQFYEKHSNDRGISSYWQISKEEITNGLNKEVGELTSEINDLRKIISDISKLDSFDNYDQEPTDSLVNSLGL